ncbi:hypothetical protein IW261DRAFT_1461782 [Armillaria novae-zelandiae]|uniref:Uncharacterized protein n=1 Tax=Armillaria novae-zelandiae TaxID=153914 RepID=A0AA39PF86_9AGAR|nr:hypothetical protein IW261DRAFT_1461782 [Armillaria novae-zelandiae]
MSSILLPSRGQCIQITDDRQPCQCVWFFPPESPLLDQVGSHPPALVMLMLSQDICGRCRHGVHAHVNYISTVVNNYPGNRCAAYAEKTRLTQDCTCGAQFYDHIATYNLYRLREPWTVILEYFNPGIGSSSATTMIDYSNDANVAFSPAPRSSDYTPAISSDDASNISVTPAHVYSTPVASTSSTVQTDTAGTLRYSPDGYFPHYSNHPVNSPPTPEGGATNGSFQYQDFQNSTYPAPPEGWSGP